MNAIQHSPDILTVSGNNFNFLEPHLNVYRIEDIAHALSHVCRFAGHTRKFYSVAQHSVLVSQLLATVHPESQMAGLLHDASEAFVGDVTSPLKQLLPEYKVIEQRIEAALFSAFGLPFPMSEKVKYADLVLLATEQRDLMPPSDNDWARIYDIKPMKEIITPLTHEEAELAFLERYHELTQLVVC